MSLKRELSEIDLAVIAEGYESVFSFGRASSDPEEEVLAAFDRELDASPEHLKVFDVISQSFIDATEVHIAQGRISKDKIADMVAGIMIVKLFFSDYIDRQVPDHIPPDTSIE